MIESSAAYKSAVKADYRRTLIKAVIEIIDPDIAYGSVSGSASAGYSMPEQVVDDEFVSQDNYATLELNRWTLDGSFEISPDTIEKEVGYIGKDVSGTDGTFETAQTVTINFSGVETLQSVTLSFSDNFYDGVAEDFTVIIGSTVKTITGNRSARVIIGDFTESSPTSITISVTKWSMPGRHMRIIEIFPGLHEEWSGDDIYSLSINQQANLAAVALPYGTATLAVDNTDRRFEPTSPTGIFKSIEDRQGIDISLGVMLPSGAVEYKKVGRYYQYSGGWKTGQNAMTIQWSLVDVVGMLSAREYILPSTLPTTASGWIASVVAQLGTNFLSQYVVDQTLASVALSPDSRENVTGKKCADILSWVAMAAGGYIVADASTGKLALKAIGNSGGSVALDDLESFPTVSANEDVAALIFTIHNGASELPQHTVAGNAPASSNTLSIDNPFIKSTTAADAVAARILKFYGGNAFDSTGRGDPAEEIGDADTLEIADGQTVSARRYAQSFAFGNGVLSGCKSQYIEVKT